MTAQPPTDKQEAAKAAFLAGETKSNIARSIGVSRPTLDAWIKKGDWEAQKIAASKVVPMRQREEGETPRERSPRPARLGRSIDELETVEVAICDVSGAMGQASSEDIRSLGGLATALVKLLEYRRKINPPNTAALVEQILEMGVSPAELVAELKQAWQKQA